MGKRDRSRQAGGKPRNAEWEGRTLSGEKGKIKGIERERKRGEGGEERKKERIAEKPKEFENLGKKKKIEKGSGKQN